MGIYVAKKTFEDFRLVFLDGMDRPAAWMPGRVIGTLITLSVKMDAVQPAELGAANGR
jgi:hypothetical protein